MIVRPHNAAASRGWLIPLAVLPLVFLSACGESPVRPEPEPEPEPDLSIGEVFYHCGQWRQGRPSAPRVIVDLVVIPGRREDVSRPYPVSPEDEAVVVGRAGGRILHRFNAQMLRMDLATDSLPLLIDSMSVAYFAISVPDTLRTDYEAGLSFDHAVTRQDSLAIRRLGGWAVTFVPNLLPQYMRGEIPDSIVPVLRARGLTYLDPGSGPGCAGSD